MMRIESGATRDRRIRTVAFTGGCLFLAGWFAYDGCIGYAAANVTEMKRVQPPDSAGSVRVDARVVETLQGRSAAELRVLLGEPPMKGSSEVRYFGEGGYLLVGTGATDTAKWFGVQHSAYDMWLQKLIAGAMGLVGVYLLFGLRTVFALRVVLDDAGLHPRAGKTIAWEHMAALDGSQYQEKSWVDLTYDDGRPRTYRIDSYVLAEFDAIVREICRRKGFACPLPEAAEASSSAPAQPS